jgi:hypothetical protein
VWEVVADWERYAVWMPDVAWVRHVSGEPGVGLELAVRTKVLGIPVVTDRMRVTAWDPPRRMAIHHEGLVSGPADWRLEPSGDGGTRFLWTEELRMPPPVLGDVGLWLYWPVLRLTFRWSIRNLARLVREG